VRFEAGGMRPLASFFATILKTKRSTWDRHANDFRSNVPGQRRMKILRIAAIMNGKFESTSKNYDESNLNRLCLVPGVSKPSVNQS